MLSHEQILKVARFNAQYGEPEQTFSPSWHAENPLSPAAQGVLNTVDELRAEHAVILNDDGTFTAPEAPEPNA